jgi:hypothetical protein
MVCKVQAQDYIFQPLVRKAHARDMPVFKEVSFRFNPLHDLESTWWIAVWCLFHSAPLGAVPNDEQYANAAKLFPVNGSSVERQNAFSIQGSFKKMTKSLPGEFLPIAEHMDNLHHYLVQNYTDSSNGSNISPSIHDEVQDVFQESKDLCINMKIGQHMAKRKLKKSMGGVGRPKRHRTGKTTDGELGGGSNNST